jgi:hypothetical protein
VNTIRITAALAVASGVAVASLAAPAAAHPSAATAAPTTKSPAAAAAGFLARHLVGAHKDHLLYAGTTYTDDGGTADAILSMDAAGYAQAAAGRATKWLESDAANYAYGKATGSGPDGWYPGAVAKLLLVAEAQHVNPKKFGGTDLTADLIGDEGAGGTPAGQFQNPADLTYGQSVLDQALAVLALSDTTAVSGQPDVAAVDFLAGQQCADGEFQDAIRTNTALDCTDTGDTDTTAYAAQALIAGGDRGAAQSAVAWLQSHENANGGWPASGATSSNANSTAIAVEALLAAHKTAGKGIAWLATRQFGCSAKAADRGAIAYTAKSTTYNAGSDVLATTQAGVALAGKPLAWVDKQGAHAATPVLACPKAKKKK